MHFRNFISFDFVTYGIVDIVLRPLLNFAI
jgi:hypothetical protein